MYYLLPLDSVETYFAALYRLSLFTSVTVHKRAHNLIFLSHARTNLSLSISVETDFDKWSTEVLENIQTQM